MPRLKHSSLFSGLITVLGLAVGIQSAGALGISTNGTEYPIVGSYEGDQLFSSVAYNGRYGFVLWQDSKSDGKGSGIVARQLSAGFSAGLSPAFRVNSLTAGYQERPKAALFADGTAIFCWEGGEGGKHQIYLRILDKKGIFPAPEVVASQTTSQDSIDVGVAVLSNGNAVVIWSAFGPDGDMQGVFGRIVDPKGKFIGGIFTVNQFTSFNQRNPDVVALPGGGFAVCWISEQQRMIASEFRGQASVDVYARVFDAAGTAAASEFRVNRQNSMCANPVLSTTEAGQLVIVWSEQATIRLNSWEIMSAVCGLDGVLAGDPARVNQYQKGNQIVPTICRAGDLQVVAWTSIGQDGNREGVYARSLTAGVPTGDEMRVNSWTPASQIQPVAVSDGGTQVAILWSTFLANRGFDLHAQRYSVGATVPQPEPPFVAGSSLNTLQVNWPELAGYNLANYELSMDGAAGWLLPQNHYSVTDLAAGSTHNFRLRYVLKNGDKSLWSEPASGKVWGADQNGDGIPDDWQVQFWGSDSAKWALASADSDGDGASNRSEFLAGTDPLSNASVLRLRVTHLPHGARLQWNTVPGYVYQVQVSDGLPVNWTDIGGIRFARGVTDSLDVSHEGRSGLYRVIRLQ